jgi:hypothetical protein
LNVDAAESYQIALYGVGGQFLPHKDFFKGEGATYSEEKARTTGDRMATWLTYVVTRKNCFKKINK